MDYHCFIVSWIINTSLEFVFEQLFRRLRLGRISGKKLLLYGVIPFEIILLSTNLKFLPFYSYFEFIGFGINIDFLFCNFVKLWNRENILYNRIRME